VRITWILFGAATILGLVALGRAAARRPQGAVPFADVRRPIIFAHRGGAGEAPESTMTAILAAASDPEMAIELDVRRTRDGHIIVFHDGTVDRTTEGGGEVADMDLAQLKALDAGFCATPGYETGTAVRGSCHQETAARFPLRGKNHRIATLAEVLAALPKKTLIGIEVKAPGFEEQLATMLRASGRVGRLIVGSEDPAIAERLNAVLPEVPHYFPASAAVRFVVATRLGGGYLSWPTYQVLAVPRAGGGLRADTARLIAGAHRRGVLVAYWVINDESDMEALIRLGADAIMTDYPARARQVMQRIGMAPAR
jgi:glycerophosphoryl diester phosphodiesterase